MAAPIVYNDVAEGANLHGQLFAGVKFWVAQRVPSRNHYLDLIRSNGGEIVALEKKADYLIADHVRKDSSPGSISYTFIDESIQKAEIADPEHHLAAPPVGTAREPGSRSRPTRGGRRPFTAEEDRLLYKWVRDCEAGNSGLSGGNEIYKQLEAKYPSHPWQSWRDRYLKQLQHRPPAAFNIPENAPSSPPSDQSAVQLPRNRSVSKQEKKHSAATSRRTKASEKMVPGKSTGIAGVEKRSEYTVDELGEMFNVEEWEDLYANVLQIKEDEDNDLAWNAVAQAWTISRTAEQLEQYFKKIVRPQWEQDPEWKREEVKKRYEARMARQNYEEAKQTDDVEESEPFVEQEQVQSYENRQQEEDEQMNEVEGAELSVRNGLNQRDESGQRDDEEQIGDAKETDPLPPKLKVTKIAPSNVRFSKEDLSKEDLSKEDLSKEDLSKEDLSKEDPLVQKYFEERYGKKPRTAYGFWACGTKPALWESQPHLSYTDLHRILKPQWDALMDEEKAPYHTMEAADERRIEIETTMPSSQVLSSTIRQKTPNYYTKAFEKDLETIRSISEVIERVEDQDYHRSKRPRHETSSPCLPKNLEQVEVTEENVEQSDFIGTQQQPLEISSGENSSASDSQEEIVDDLPKNQDMDAALQLQLQTQELDDEEASRLTETGGSDEGVRSLEKASSSNCPSQTPTPIAPRHQTSAFDTQAILSSPIQNITLGRLPRLPGLTQLTETQQEFHSQNRSSSVRSSSPICAPESMSSPTHSLEEFRRSLNGTLLPEDYSLPAAFDPIPRPQRSPSPTVSDASSTNSGDPDPPLHPSEFTDYFDESHADGFDDMFITTALKHTRCRPDLATTVMEAWKKGEPLPDQRGVWSKDDDEDVESGNADALKRLEMKHTCDGWGGITERLRFLEQYRIRS